MKTPAIQIPHQLVNRLTQSVQGGGVDSVRLLLGLRESSKQEKHNNL